MVKYSLERSVLKSSAIDITSDPIVIEDRGSYFGMIHIVGGTGNTGIVLPRLPDKFKEIVDAGQDVIHEDNGIEVLVLRIAQFVERNKGRIADLGEILDAVIKLTSSTLRRPNHDAHANAPCQRIKNPKERFGLVVGTIFVDGDEDIMVAKNGCYAEKGCKKIRDDVERVIEVDCEEIFVLFVGKI